MNNQVEISVGTATVWGVFAAVERWSEWTASVEQIVALDGPGIEVGKRFEIKQPRLPTLVWQVTEVDPGVSWTWRQVSLGAIALARHEVLAQGDSRSLVSQRIEHRGPIGTLTGVVLLPLTRRYLRLEAQGLKARCVQGQTRDGASA